MMLHCCDKLVDDLEGVEALLIAHQLDELAAPFRKMLVTLISLVRIKNYKSARCFVEVVL